MILDKAKMAHDWAMKHGKADTIYNRKNTVELAWEYADLMQDQEDKRVKKKAIDDAESSKVFFEKLTESHCSHETLTGSIPDSDIESFKCKLCNEFVDAEKWKDSLRKRP